MSNKLRTVFLSSCSLLLTFLLSACGDSGGGSGDAGASDANAAAVQAVAPVVGIWDLPNDWRSGTNDQVIDEAYLVVRTPDADGVSIAIIYDQDDSIPGGERGCFIISGLPGFVEQSLMGELFLDISEYPTAIVSLNAGGNLEIEVFEEGAGSAAAPVNTLTAIRIDGLAEQDIPICDS